MVTGTSQVHAGHTVMSVADKQLATHAHGVQTVTGGTSERGPGTRTWSGVIPGPRRRSAASVLQNENLSRGAGQAACVLHHPTGEHNRSLGNRDMIEVTDREGHLSSVSPTELLTYRI